MAAKKTSAPAVPEVRQCTDPDNWQFGTVAVAAGQNRWGAMNPNNGGYWATDSDVQDWTVKT